MTRSLALAATFAFSSMLPAQTVTNQIPPVEVASLEHAAVPAAPVSTSFDSLPDAPSANMESAAATTPTDSASLGAASMGSASLGSWMGGQPAPVAGKYDMIILPGQTAVPLHGMQKALYGLHDAFDLQQLAVVTLSAGWSHLIDSAPHYGTNSEAFGKREGAAALRGTVQTLATDAVFSPMFHDDPRYYELGDDHKLLNRVVYAASRVVITRSSHSTQQRINIPLLLGYGAAAGLNNAYYPDRDTGIGPTFKSWGTSLAGAALGFEVSEFLDDALKAVHLRKQ